MEVNDGTCNKGLKKVAINAADRNIFLWFSQFKFLTVLLAIVATVHNTKVFIVCLFQTRAFDLIGMPFQEQLFTQTLHTMNTLGLFAMKTTFMICIQFLRPWLANGLFDWCVAGCVLCSH